MPGDDLDSAAIAKVQELGRQAAGNMLDTLIRVFSLQAALVNNKVLTQEQLDEQYQAVNGLESVQAVRKQYGGEGEVLGAVLDNLLRNYRGPMQ
jgi:hypothetical protein